MRDPALFAFALLAGACANLPADNPPSAPSAAPSPVVVGGYAPADMNAPEVKAAYGVALGEVYKRNPTRALDEKKSAEQQVVAGMNYRFRIEMTGGAVYSVTVYRDLQGAMAVSDYQKLS
jgi:hypothetical protein